MPNPTRAQAIKKLLDARTQPDLAMLYHAGMELQVNVARDDGMRKDGYTGGSKQTYTNGIQTWYAFRVPKNAWSDPEDTSGIEMSYSLFDHAENVGMTGWCFTQLRSIWVAFDFDAIVGHSERHQKKLTDAELDRVKEAACKIPWVTVRRSTSGNGLHLYVFFAEPVPTKNHTQHAALGQAVLSEMSALVGFDFQAKVDACGGNMWVWGRKMPLGPSGTQKDGIGLQLVRQALHPLASPPKGWERYERVQKSERKKSLPEFAQGNEQTFDETAGQQPKVPLDEHHQKLIAWLQQNQGWGWWDADHHMLVTHTHHLKRAHAALEMRGTFETTSPASQVDEQNAFAFPTRGGGWSVRRYSKGAAEHASWQQDGKGWTRCFLNRDPDLRQASVAHGGVETANGSFQFPVLDDVQKVVQLVGGSLEVPNIVAARPGRIMPHKDGRRVIVEVDAFSQDSPSAMAGWYKEKGKAWRIVVNANAKLSQEDEVGTFDELVRHATTEQRMDGGWFVKVEDKWNHEPKTHVSLALLSVGKKRLEVDALMGASVLKPWVVVSRPFEEEYPGDRQWNRSKVRLRYPKSEEVGEFPHWRMLFEHVYCGLDEALAVDGWALANDVRHGYEWAELWFASMLQDPYAQLPYQFLWSHEQDTGKSSIHEAAGLLITDDGIVEANKVIEGKDSFNGQMEGAVLCYVEELNLNKNKGAYERIKNWVTSPRISIRKLYLDAYQMPNTTHWIHCANDHEACPVFPGDTRITMVHVPPIPVGKMIPKPELMARLKREAPHFMNYLLKLEVPPSGSRLMVPVINTSEKDVVASGTRDALQAFIDEFCFVVPGAMIPFSEFFDKFREQLDPGEAMDWNSRGKVSKGIPPGCPIGKQGPDSYIGNLSWTSVPPKRKLVLQGRKLIPAPELAPRQAQSAPCGQERLNHRCSMPTGHVGTAHKSADGVEWS